MTNILDQRLITNGKRLGDATRAEIEKEAAHLKKLAAIEEGKHKQFMSMCEERFQRNSEEIEPKPQPRRRRRGVQGA